ncbi:MAG: FAD:protein FMN transferase [Deltaproteobacteria bacterium]|nr:FAD:protein FMN transferase [Deltaproteobacteria bacterium]
MANKNSTTKKIVAAIIVLAVAAAIMTLAAIVLFSGKGTETKSYSRMQMGTLVQIDLKDENLVAADKAFAEIDRLEKLLSSYIASSDVSKVSSNAGKGPVKVSAETIEVVKTALLVAEKSNGAFDPTIGALAKLWGFSGETKTVPDEEEIKKLLPLVNYKNVKINEAASTIELKNRGMVLNLGGVAKGYIVGRAFTVLKKSGVKWAIVHAGGDMYLYQDSRMMEPFKIGVKNPLATDKLIGTLKVTAGAISTSGDYERFFEKDGKRYHHILDPATGFPADKCHAVTIVSEDPLLGDALSTAVFVLGKEKGMKLAESFSGVNVIVVDLEGKVHSSKGLAGKLDLL